MTPSPIGHRMLRANHQLDRSGFTLIELMVALSVASIALVAGFGALAVVEDRGMAAEEVNRAALSGATQRALLTDWLAGARYRASASAVFQGLDGADDEDLGDVLVFPTTARTPVSDISTVVGLFIDDDPETPERGLVAELSGVNLTSTARLLELVPSAGAIEIRYWPEADGAADWEDGWSARGQLPRGVQITLSPAAGDSLPPLLRLPLRVALASFR
jgi:prepilin-type N-terminal cleavage/methylation domain-containing protein